MTLQGLKGIPLEYVLAELGFAQVEPRKWQDGAAVVTVTADGGAWFDHMAGKGGGGALDLVAHLRGVPVGKAAGILRKLAGSVPATAPARRVPAAPEPAVIPEAHPGHWERVRAYLMGRGIPAPLLDALHASGDLYADRMANAVFACRDAAGAVAGASKRGTGPTPFKQRIGGKDLSAFAAGSATPCTVAVVESAIDALSFLAMFGEEGPLLVVSTDGGGSVPAWLIERHSRARWVLAQDADAAGDKLAAEVKRALARTGWTVPTFRHTPKGGKDWNAVLLAELARWSRP